MKMKIHERLDSQQCGQELLEFSLLIVEGPVDKRNALMVHAAALRLAASVLETMHDTQQKNKKHAAARAVLHCIAYLLVISESWADEAGKFEVSP